MYGFHGIRTESPEARVKKMKRSKLPKSPMLVVSIFICIALCVAIVAVSARSSSRSRQQEPGQEIQVRNYIRGLEVVGRETVGEDYVILLRNVSGKAISAYKWTLGPTNQPTSGYDTDGAISGQVTASGAILRVEVPLIAFVHSAQTLESPVKILNFVAVLFDDKTSEGFPRFVKLLENRRLGNKIQLKRIKALLREAAMTEDSLLPAKLSELISRVSELPETAEDDDEFHGIQTGLLAAKRHIVVLLEHLSTEHGGAEKLQGPNRAEHARKILSSLIEQSDVWLSRY
jgi:hypothetical protein